MRADRRNPATLETQMTADKDKWPIISLFSPCYTCSYLLCAMAGNKCCDKVDLPLS